LQNCEADGPAVLIFAEPLSPFPQRGEAHA
jgi:hypothetical protein